MKSKHRTRQPRIIPINPGLQQLIEGKRERHWIPSHEERKLGFQGWHQRGYLPHFDAPDVAQLVTFMLIDSFPVERKAAWQSLLNESDASTWCRQLENWLDRGHGECWLKRAEIAEAMQHAILDRNDGDYRLRSWCLMPNHMHVLLDIWDTPLQRIVRRWKGVAARECNRRLGRSGSFWQPDYFDTLIRNERHLRQAIRYVEANPVKARLVRDETTWPWSSASRRDEYGRLPWEVGM